MPILLFGIVMVGILLALRAGNADAAEQESKPVAAKSKEDDKAKEVAEKAKADAEAARKAAETAHMFEVENEYKDK